MNKFYLLERKEYSYDEVRSMVVEASSENVARSIASKNTQDEPCSEWVDPNLSSCEIVRIMGYDRLVHLQTWDG